MNIRTDMKTWIIEALRRRGGRAKLVDVARGVWEMHEADLRMAGDAFFTWQYDLRWAADRLRRDGVLKAFDASNRSYWEIAPGIELK